jgi:hypothetical protein
MATTPPTPRKGTVKEAMAIIFITIIVIFEQQQQQQPSHATEKKIIYKVSSLFVVFSRIKK